MYKTSFASLSKEEEGEERKGLGLGRKAAWVPERCLLLGEFGLVMVLGGINDWSGINEEKEKLWNRARMREREREVDYRHGLRGWFGMGKWSIQCGGLVGIDLVHHVLIPGEQERERE